MEKEQSPKTAAVSIPAFVSFPGLYEALVLPCCKVFGNLTLSQRPLKCFPYFSANAREAHGDWEERGKKKEQKDKKATGEVQLREHHGVRCMKMR